MGGDPGLSGWAPCQHKGPYESAAGAPESEEEMRGQKQEERRRMLDAGRWATSQEKATNQNLSRPLEGEQTRPDLTSAQWDAFPTEQVKKACCLGASPVA